MTNPEETELWEVYYTGDDCAEVDEAWLKTARGNWLCSACCYPLPGRPLEPVKLEYIPPQRLRSFNFISRPSIAFGSTDFADEIMRLTNPGDFQFGRLILPDGEEAQNLVTFRSRDPVLIRGEIAPGDKWAGTRLCPECGRRFYFARGRRYVMKGAMKGRRVASDRSGRLVIDDESLSAIMQHLPKRGYGPWRLEILETPLDGLSIDDE